MKISKKSLILSSIGGIALLGGVLTAGAAYAQSTSSTGNPIFARVAQILGIDKSKLTSALQQAQTENVDQKLKDGNITQNQADAMKQKIASGQSENFGEMRGGKMGMEQVGQNQIDKDLATFLGITESDINTSLKSGKKISEIITAKGKTQADAATYLKLQAKTRIQQEVTDKKITQTQTDTRITEENTRIDNFVNDKMPTHMEGKGMRRENNHDNTNKNIKNKDSN